MERQRKRTLDLALAMMLAASLGYGQTDKPQGRQSGPPAQPPGAQGERMFGDIVSVGVDRIEIKKRTAPAKPSWWTTKPAIDRESGSYSWKT